MKHAYITVDCAAGDQGKGSIVDSLVREYRTKYVIRYCGGCQAGHRVVTDNQEHIFSQFGSGTFVGAQTILTHNVIFSPLILEKEAEQLQTKGIDNPLNLIHVVEGALIVTPYHRALNRLLEISRGQNKHGSCGMGVGATKEDSINRPDGAIRIGDILDTKLLKKKLIATKNYIYSILPNGLDTKNELVKKELSTFDYPIPVLVRRMQNVIKQIEIIKYEQFLEIINTEDTVWEGAQGILLDENFGFHPYTTYSDVSTNGYESLFDLNKVSVEKIGILRTFFTRHGVGPFPSELANQKEYNEYPGRNQDHNTTNQWQDNFRIGALDIPLLKYSLSVNPVDSLAITWCDILESKPYWPVILEYNKRIFCTGTLKGQEILAKLMMDKEKFYPYRSAYLYGKSIPEFTTWALNKPIKILSYGPSAKDKYFM